MFRSYLSIYPLIFLICISFFSIAGGGIVTVIVLVLILLYFFLMFIFIEKPININSPSIHSPISGRVKSIERNQENGKFEIVFRVSLFKGYGIIFPSDLEVFDIILKDCNCRIVFKDYDFSFTEICFKKNIFGFFPKLFIIPGDRGKRGISMGYFPFGGTVLLYLSEKYEIIVNAGDYVSIGAPLVKLARVEV